MRAVVYLEYGEARDVLRLEEVPVRPVRQHQR